MEKINYRLIEVSLRINARFFSVDGPCLRVLRGERERRLREGQGRGLLNADERSGHPDVTAD